MNRRVRWLVAALVLLLLLFLGAGGWYWWTTRPTSALAGQVVAAEVKGLAVVGAEVQIVGTDRTVRTDHRGSFAFDRLPAGRIELTVVAKTFEAKTLPAELARGAETKVEVVLNGGAFPKGLVVDAASGRPVAGAKVRVKQADREPVPTGPDGSFRLPVLVDRKADLQVEAAGYRSAAAVWPGEGKPLRIQLTGGAAIKGRVVEDPFEEVFQTVKPVAGATVCLAGPDHAVQKAQADADGQFTLAPVRGGQKGAVVEVSAEGFAAKQATVDLPGEGEATVEVRLPGAGTLAGVVKDRVTGKPVPGAAVTIRDTRLKVETKADGSFALSSVPLGQQRVRATADGWAPEEQGVTVKKNGSQAALVLSGVHTLRGTIVWRDKTNSVPVPKAAIAVEGTDVSSTADDKGAFVIDRLPPWPTKLAVSAQGFRARQVERDPRADRGEAIALEGEASLNGRVVDAMYEEPRGVADVEVRLADSPLAARTGPDGRFSFDNVRSGDVRIEVSPPGYVPAAKDLSLTPDKPNPAGDIALTGNSRLNVTLVEQPSGGPVPNGEVRIEGTRLTAKSDADGRCTFTAVSPGPAKIVAAAARHADQQVPVKVAAGENTVKVALDRNAVEMKVRVVDEQDQAVPKATVVVARKDGEPLTVETNDQGECQVKVPDRLVTLTASRRGFATEEKKLDVDASEAPKIVLRKSPDVVVVTEKPVVVPVPETLSKADVVPPSQAPAGLAKPVKVAAGVGPAAVATVLPGTGASGPGSGASGTGGSGGGGGGGPGAAGGPGQGPGVKYRQSFLALPDEEQQKRVVFYIATGEKSSAGRVHMVSVWGDRMTSVGLVKEGSPTGMAFHKAKELVVAIPRKPGKILRIDHEGNVRSVLEESPALLHPVDLAVPGQSDDILVADDISRVLARTKTDGQKPEVLRSVSSKLDEGLSLAVTKDRQDVVFGAEGEKPGVYRFSEAKGPDNSARMLPKFGGVAADPLSRVWAAAQPPNLIYVYDGEQWVKTLALPDNMVHYRNGLLAFTCDDGWLCVACHEENAKPEDGAQIYLCNDIEKGEYQRLFGWGSREWKAKDMANVSFTDRGINDLAVGPWMRWPGAPPPGGAKSGKSLGRDQAGGNTTQR